MVVLAIYSVPTILHPAGLAVQFFGSSDQYLILSSGPECPPHHPADDGARATRWEKKKALARG